ncbi:MAG: hypothetical protein ACI86H_002861 [bacterium]|jgi:hypothetical protein
MSTKLRIYTRIRRLIQYIEDLENGILQVPQYIEDLENGILQVPVFQRGSTWRNKEKLDLLDSLKRGYPIGSILLWQPTVNKKYVEVKKIAHFFIPAKQENYFYILDGFQRLGTILGCLINPKKSSLNYDENEAKKFSIYYDLETEEFFFPQTLNVKKAHQIPVYQLLDTRASFLFERELRKQDYNLEEIDLYISRLIDLSTMLIDYSLPSIDMIGGEMEEVEEVFSRINSGGSDISSDSLLSSHVPVSNQEKSPAPFQQPYTLASGRKNVVVESNPPPKSKEELAISKEDIKARFHQIKLKIKEAKSKPSREG